MARRKVDTKTLDIFESPQRERRLELDWPPAARFPLNLGGRTVAEQVVADLSESPEPLVVTGYASLDELIALVASLPRGASRARLLFGSEPFPGRREEYRMDGDPFPEEVERYWLERGISLLWSAKLIDFIERLRAGEIEARYLAQSRSRLHAKIYVGDAGATVGSSNFTGPGLRRHLEANARFTSSKEARRYRELRGIAENYWTLGRDYRDALIALLEKLLRLVGWREALARACAELLEGEWAARYLAEDARFGGSELWPSQRQGIARALYILDRQGSVLIADATGSGKTRMGAHLTRAITQWMLRSGRLRYGRATMICPPTVSDAWQREVFEAGTQLDVRSHGSLSHGQSAHHDLIVESLRQAQVLCVDEGHNFLNLKSNRTRLLLRNMADHVILFTATPINRSVVDLLRIADMLGADNLEPSTLKAFGKMLGTPNADRMLTDDQRDTLRTEIRRFTVRRTKRDLNALIDEEPGAYRDARGKRCRFPKHDPHTYALDEPRRDREAAAEIRELAGSLHAATHFRKPLELPEALRREGWTEEQYVASRLESARKLARYMVMKALRSSRAALIEHLDGTANAKRIVKLQSYKRKTGSGNMLGILSSIAGHPPKIKVSVPVPDWLRDPEAHRRACGRDRRIYARILKLVAALSDGRERRKVALMLELLGRHGLVLAFDSRPITLALFAQMIETRRDGVRTLVATGDRSTQRRDVLSEFAPGATGERIIGLCSDSLAEGVNLQRAPCMVHLDMPSVVRIAEQRVGRVDRMDSPHRRIEAWWPDDAVEFALSSDERFIERYETVERLLGSNMPLPEAMMAAGVRAVTAEEMIEALEREQADARWDGIEDAFAPVRALVEGDGALVAPEIYRRYRHVSVRVLSRVSLVKASRPWAFFCLAGGGGGGAPRWVLLSEEGEAPVTDLDEAAKILRERLGDAAEDLPMDARASEVLSRFLRQLARADRLLLSRRKQRALEEMEAVLTRFSKAAVKAGASDRAHGYARILQVLRSEGLDQQPDWDEFATRWLDVIRRVWYDRLASKRSKPLLLKDIRSDLVKREAEVGPVCIERFRAFPLVAGPDERIRACIVGVA